MPEEFLDPVAAYDRLAPHFDRLVARRERYLRGVDAAILARVPGDAASLLDVGAGDGRRALRIAAAARIGRVVLVEPSSAMARRAGPEVEVRALRAEDLEEEPGIEAFDVVTCLWNVLGHVRPASSRRAALAGMARLLAPGGRLFIDVTHRYNARSYGLVRTLGRRLHDAVLFGERSGDVTARWSADGETCSTYGHVFTDREMRRLLGAAGLVVEERLVLDYETGETRRWAFQGNLLYVLRHPRDVRPDPSLAPSL